jgi:hypothetical protein
VASKKTKSVSFVKSAKRMKFLSFWKEHPNYTAATFTILGIGLGLLGQTYIKDGYVNVVGWAMVFVSAVANLYPAVA